MLAYATDRSVSPEQFADVLRRSTLGERRPLHDAEAIRGMIENANLVATCWEGEKLVGIARSVTDFHYCCYLSDLAVDEAYQRQGIGKRLIEETAGRLRKECKVILLAAPAAVEYYPHIGFEHHPQAWIRKV